MIEVNKGNAKQTLADDKLAAVCVELAGGGYTAQQTAKAMEYRQQLVDGKTIKAKGFTVKII